MIKRLYVLATSLFLVGAAQAAGTRLNCKAPTVRTPYTAALIGEGMNRIVQVTFKSKPATADATAAVQACIKAVVAMDSSVDALGSAWVGDDPVKLKGGTYFAYISATKKFQFM